MKLKWWHFALGGVGAAGASVLVWYLVARAETEIPPEQRMPETPDPKMTQGTQTVMGYSMGKATPITISPVGNNQFMRTDAAKAYLAMKAAAKAAGHNFSETSGFRSMAKQEELYARYKAGTGNLAARPGYSNHQDGTSIDIGGIGGYDTKAYAWMKANALSFGFVNDARGEWWHWTYKVPPTQSFAGIAKAGVGVP